MFEQVQEFVEKESDCVLSGESLVKYWCSMIEHLLITELLSQELKNFGENL